MENWVWRSVYFQVSLAYYYCSNQLCGLHLAYQGKGVLWVIQSVCTSSVYYVGTVNLD